MNCALWPGNEFVDGINGVGYGLVPHPKMPGDVIVRLYEPRHSKKSRS